MSENKRQIKPLTNQQAEALIKLRDHGPRSAYPGIHLATLNALLLRGMVRAEHLLVPMALPSTSIKWSITDKGRFAVEP